MGLYLIADSWWLQPENLISLAKAGFGLGVVIFVHELGHFLVAKACGVKCEKFYVGFDVPMQFGPFKLPAALWKKQVGETEYGIGMIPLGGYVKMLGQDDNPTNASAEAEKIRVAREEGKGYELDPRSYPAKSVPQRMAIISAGVIMNLIFAVIFAAAAYMMGLKYTPAVVGSTMPGESAWTAGMRAGDHMIQLGRDGRRDEQLRFRDLRYNVMVKNDDRSFNVTVKRLDGTEHAVDVRPVARKGEHAGLPKIGVISLSANRLFKLDFNDGSVASQSDIQKGDIIRKVIVGGVETAVENAIQTQNILYANYDLPITLVVDRLADPADKTSPATEHRIELPPQPAREIGFRAGMGPIVGVQNESPAVLAGFQVGDVMQSIDGEEIRDPLTVDALLQKKAGSHVTVKVQRGASSVELQVTPRALDMLGDSRRPGGPVAAETIGVAYGVIDEIVEIVPGGPAEAAGLQVGDKLTGFQFVATPELEIPAQQVAAMRLEEPLEFTDERLDWAYANYLMQTAPTGVNIKLTCQRGTKKIEVELTPVKSTEAFEARRGLLLEGLSRVRTATSWSEACRLGLRETKEGIEQVFMTLARISKLYKHLGGPGSIAVAATAEASEGFPRLLVFLTLLSANLAVLNFLPIPVLDGGHMMFLLYEGIFGKPMNQRIAFMATMVGLCLILGLMLFVIGMDVFRFSGLLG